MEPEWAMFLDSTGEVAVRSSDCNVVGACCAGNPQTRWWTPVVKGVAGLKKEAIQSWLTGGTPKATEKYPQAKWKVTLAVAETRSSGVGVIW